MTAAEHAAFARTWRWILFSLAAFWVMVISIAFPPAPRLVWNASASMPVGLYWVRPGAPAARGGTVVAWTPEPYRGLAATRHYLPRNVPLVKRVAGMPGDRVCAAGSAIFLNGRFIAARQRVDGAGRRMPWWDGCRTLRHDEYFLLVTNAPASFDGRYFGVTSKSDIIGQAHLLWPR